MTAALAAWLLANDGPIAADEILAQTATPSPWRIDERRPNVILESLPIDSVGVTGHRLDVAPVFTGQLSSRARSQWVADAAHIAAWHPARVLAECAAKRAIVKMHVPYRVSTGVDYCPTCGEGAPCETLLALAQPYAGRPGWHDEWRTT